MERRNRFMAGLRALLMRYRVILIGEDGRVAALFAEDPSTSPDDPEIWPVYNSEGDG